MEKNIKAENKAKQHSIQQCDSPVFQTPDSKEMTGIPGLAVNIREDNINHANQHPVPCRMPGILNNGIQQYQTLEAQLCQKQHQDTAHEYQEPTYY